MSRLSYALPAAVFCLGLGAVRPAAAQQPIQQGAPVIVPHRVMHPAQGRATGFDCAIEALSVSAYPRRLMTFVDVTVRVRGVRGGFCAVRPDGVQVQTARLGAGVGGNRFTGIFVENGQTRWPGEVTEFRSASERLEPWVADLKPGEVRTVSFRSVYETDLPPKGEPELLAKVRVQLAAFGPKVVTGAPAELRLVTEPNAPVRAVATTVNGSKQGTEPITPGVPLQVRQTLEKDKLTPLIEWRYESGGPPAPTSANALSSPLALLEYLRFGLVRDLAAAYTAKDAAKRVPAALDDALSLTFAAARSEDALVAGVGLRAFAWVANGLNATAWRVRSASEGGDGAVVVPDAVAAELAKVVPNFERAIGMWEPPSPIGARSSRSVAAAFGDPLENKKMADQAMARLVKRLDQAKAPKAPVLFAHYPVPTLGATPPPESNLVEFRPTGPKVVSPTGASSTAGPAGPPSRRFVRLLTHPRKAWKHLLVLGAIVGAAAGLYVALGNARRQQASTV